MRISKFCRHIQCMHVPDMDQWDKLPACLLGMTGKMPVATKSFSFSGITFEERHRNVSLNQETTKKASLHPREGARRMTGLLRQSLNKIRIKQRFPEAPALHKA